ncbi:MAG: Nramp family divalent metal transporter [Planctomycetota bacterium]|nr:Nramp family divalent metal transporter [Planctomycetota bacterium]MDA1252593.1 Nramp family divalent metal transporter [Planctomycetota bacterium]
MTDSQKPALPETCLPTWEVDELPEPKPLGLKNLAGFIGPGIVMCGIQIGGGEWLFGPAITAKYGGGLMWIATVAIICQCFYNIECGRYALYTGEPVFTGFMRTKPGPAFWVSVAMLISIGALIPGLSTNAAVLLVSMHFDRPPAAAEVAAGDSIRVVETDSAGIRTTTELKIETGAAADVRIEKNETGFVLSGTGTPGATIQLIRPHSDKPDTDGNPLYNERHETVSATVADDGTWSVDRPDDGFLVNMVAYLCLAAVVLPVLVGGKIYNVLQVVMTAKVVIVLSFCLIIGLFYVSAQGWLDVFSGFLKFGNLPVEDENGKETVVNVFGHLLENGAWPLIAMGNIALLGAFAGYAGGGGLSNSTYSNFVRDKGWGMGSKVGAIASAVGGRDVKLSHLGKVFEITEESLRRWKAWWKYIITDQVFIWAPGCFMGMALPALLSIEYARESSMFDKPGLSYSQPLIAAHGIRSGEGSDVLWLATLFVGLMIFLPSQMAIVEDFARRWSDIIWSGNQRVRDKMSSDKVKYIYYGILGSYVLWSFIAATIFLNFGNAPTVMVTVIANLNNVALGLTAFHILWINRNFLPVELRPKWYSQLGITLCGVFYFGLAVLVFVSKVVPMMSTTGWLIFGVVVAALSGLLFYLGRILPEKQTRPIRK